MATGERQESFTVTNLGIGDGIAYSKADIVQITRWGDNYAVNFYQFDYTSLAAAATAGGGKIQNASSEMLLPIAKIVMDKDTFQRMVASVASFAKQDEAQE